MDFLTVTAMMNNVMALFNIHEVFSSSDFNNNKIIFAEGPFQIEPTVLNCLDFSGIMTGEGNNMTLDTNNYVNKK